VSEEPVRLQKAERYLRSAALLSKDGDLDSAASRLYYAMFYIAETLLAAKGMSFSSHQALISAYGQHFSKTGGLDARHHRALRGCVELLDLRVVLHDLDDVIEDPGKKYSMIESGSNFVPRISTVPMPANSPGCIGWSFRFRRATPAVILTVVGAC
jgi:uncharacterized protein (UPF0332 family)